MSRSLIWAVNESAQAIEANGIINPGTVIHRFGCNFGLLGNAIGLKGNGYYTLLAKVVVTPEAVGNITATLLKNGVPIPGATATASVTTVGNTITIPVPAVLRECSCCEEIKTITCQLSAAGTVENFSFEGVRE